jgi:hypothetical protein
VRSGQKLPGKDFVLPVQRLKTWLILFPFFRSKYVRTLLEKKMADYIPDDEPALVVWFNDHAAGVSTHGEAVGLSAGDITQASEHTG